MVAANLRWNTADPQRYFMRLAVWGIALHAWFAHPGPYTALLAILGVAALNGSLLFAPAALASLIVAGAAAWWQPRLPRLTRYWFYPFYPAHFAVIRWLA